ncbi:MAG: PorV/PorQ family protein [Elusimicrobiota bacterium]
MKKEIITAFLILCLYGISGAQSFDKASKGGATAQFLKIPVSPRTSAMGEASAADMKDASALDINPACLMNLKKDSFYFSHSKYIAETSMNYLAYAQNMGEEVGAWGLSFKYFGWGKMDNTDDTGGKIKTMSPYDMSIGVTFATYISGFNADEEDRFVFGGTGKVVRTQILNSASAISADLGFLTPYMMDRKLRMSLSASNIMGTMKMDKEAFPLPLIIRFGVAAFVTDDFKVTSDIIAPNDSFMYLAVGSEAKIRIARKTELFIRGGLNTKNLFDISGLKNLTGGLGFRYYEYNFDYSFSPYGELGNIHRISISLNY